MSNIIIVLFVLFLILVVCMIVILAKQIELNDNQLKHYSEGHRFSKKSSRFNLNVDVFDFLAIEHNELFNLMLDKLNLSLARQYDCAFKLIDKPNPVYDVKPLYNLEKKSNRKRGKNV